MSNRDQPSEADIRRRRRAALTFWLACLAASLLLALHGAIGLLVPVIFAFACAYMVFWNLLITISGQSDPFDMSDLRPPSRERKHYAEDDEDHWKL